MTGTDLSHGTMMWKEAASPRFLGPSAVPLPPRPGAACKAPSRHLMGHRQTSADLAEGR